MKRARRRFSIRFVAFALAPLFGLVLAAETTLRLKYFFLHDHDWGYLITPFGSGAATGGDPWIYARAAPVKSPSGRAAPVPAAVASPSAPSAQTDAASPAPRSDPVPLPTPPRTERQPSSPMPEPAATALTTSAPSVVLSPPATGTPGSALAPSEIPVIPAPAGVPVPAVPAPPPPGPKAASPMTAPAKTASAVTAPPTAVPTPAPVPQPTAASPVAPDTTQMVFKWRTPCVNQTVYSTELHKDMPRTWNEHCFRGDSVKPQKDPDEYRVIFLGGSTVEDAQSDVEMMTAQVKRALPQRHGEKRISVVNAGRAGFESARILLYWTYQVEAFSPDLVVYYEAWNEQPTDVKWTRVDQRIAGFSNWLHSTLYYHSMLYTYAVEKFAFLTTSNDHFWKIDLNRLRRSFVPLAGTVQNGGARFVFVTQVIRFPRLWKGIDTFDYQAVDALLERLRTDRQYAYDVTEISALNQRLAVLYTLSLCREHGIPVINILDQVEAQGDAGRAEMFIDLGHLSVKGDRIVGELIGARLKLAAD